MNIQSLVELVKKNPQHNYIYHFTDARNFPSIGKHGILSKDELKRRGITPDAPGGNDWSWQADQMKGLTGYVNLCLTRSHPMCHMALKEGRIEQAHYLAITPEVLFCEGVMVSLDVANKSGVELLHLAEGIQKLDLEVIYSRTNWSDPAINARLRAAEKCEILVPKIIPLALIKGRF